MPYLRRPRRRAAARRDSTRTKSYRDRTRRLQFEPLEARRVLTGVTLITHGFNSDADGWVTAMAEAIGDRPDLNVDPLVYRVELTDPGHDNGPLSVTSTKLSGPSAGCLCLMPCFPLNKFKLLITF